jgi:amino-acid N-acetyltransferase
MVVDNERVTLRTGRSEDATALHAIIDGHLEEGWLLPRTLGDLAAHAHRFVIVERGGRIVGGAELAPLSPAVAEVRSLVVDQQARGLGAARRIVDELSRRARRAGHAPAFFVRLGFSIVPHTWIPEKIAHDCAACPLFRSCGQQAMMLPLDDAAAADETSAVETEARPHAR